LEQPEPTTTFSSRLPDSVKDRETRAAPAGAIKIRIS
jgi:hypothetical protein